MNLFSYDVQAMKQVAARNQKEILRIRRLLDSLEESSASPQAFSATISGKNAGSSVTGIFYRSLDDLRSLCHRYEHLLNSLEGAARVYGAAEALAEEIVRTW